MRRIDWSVDARRDIVEAVAFIAAHDVAAGAMLRKRVDDELERLSHHSIGRRSRVSGLFEKPVSGTSYTIAYAVTDEEIVVVRVIHQSRDWREEAWPRD